MKIYKFQIFFFSIITVFFSLYSKEITSIEIKPLFTDFDSLPSIKTTLKYQVGDITDTSSERENRGIVGVTSISSKRNAPVICKPSPSKIFKESLEKMLKIKGVLIEESDSNSVLIEIVIYEFTLRESKKKFFVQSIEANIEFELILKYKNGSPERKFTIKSQNTRSAMDTTKHAEAVLRAAIRDALAEIIKVIAK